MRRALKAEFSQRTGILTPSCINLHEKLEKQPASQESFYLFSGLPSDLSKHRPFLANEDRFMGLPIGVDRGFDHDEILLLFFGKLVDSDRRAISDLFTGQKKNLFPNDLRGDKTLGLIGDLSLRVIERAFGKQWLYSIQHQGDVISLKRADSQNLGLA